MSFFGRDKSKNNLNSLFSLTPSTTQTSTTSNGASHRKSVPDRPLSPTSSQSTMSFFNSLDPPTHGGSGGSASQPASPKLVKKNSGAISPTMSSSSSLTGGNNNTNTPNAAAIDDKLFNYKYDDYELVPSDATPKTAPKSQARRNPTTVSENYSPRSSIVSMPIGDTSNDDVTSMSPSSSNLKENYRGFHANKRPKGIANVPPLSHPIKPRFKKKSGSLLGKLIYSSRKDSDSRKDSSSRKDSDSSAHSEDSQTQPESESSQVNTNSTTTTPDVSEAGSRNNSVSVSGRSQRKSASSTGSTSSASKHKFRIPSITLEHHHHYHPHHPSLTPSFQTQLREAEARIAASSAASVASVPVYTAVAPIEEKGTESVEKTPQKVETGPVGVGAFDLNLDEMHGIIKSPKSLQAKDSFTDSNHNIYDVLNGDEGGEGPVFQIPIHKSNSSTVIPSVVGVAIPPELKASIGAVAGGWRAPDSWDVKVDNINEPNVIEDLALSDSDDTDEKDINDGDYEARGQDVHSFSSSCDSVSSNESNHEHNNITHNHHHHHHHHVSHQKVPKVRETSEMRRLSNLPVLYGARSSHTSDAKAVDKVSGKPNKGPNHIVRVFKEDNTFTTILCPLETTTAELLLIVQRKFFLESISNYQISVYVGNCVKVLESFEKPLQIQLGLLLLSGYTDKDNLKIIGREDLSFVCKFVVENINLRNLTHDEETMLSRDYVDVNISGLNLKNIPIIFHQHTYEIERLNVADNPSIYIPLDFIQSCNNLISINFSRNGCSKFPMNFLEAKKLTHLDLEKNFLDELPSKFSHLKNLTHLKLNSNQLSSLPRSFGRLKNLECLNLSSNYFETYPESISELSNLRELDLSYNDLSHLPESISKLTKLSKLNLCTNKLSKVLPAYFKEMTSLKRLDIRYNLLTNVDILGSIPNLEIAYATKNSISAFSDKMESLRLLHFDRNPITELQFENLLPLLTILDLSKAKITSIPADFIARIPNIEKFVLDKNHLVTLPNELGNLKRLAFLSLFGNNLSSLPPTIGQLQSLQYLDIHSNNLLSLPDDIWNMKSLSVLNVASNILSSFPKPPLTVAKRISSTVNFRNFTGDTMSKPDLDISRRPSESVDGDDDIDDMSSDSSVTFGNSSSSLADSLLVLTLADNRLSDDCFESISFLVSLKSLNLSYNELLEIPEGAIRRMVRMTEIYLSGNELATLPADDLENLKSLKLLYVNNNKLVTLPSELSKLTNLQHLDVGSNQLKYNISNWPYDWNWHWNKNLKYLNFSGNKRFEIKQSHVKNPETGEYFDSLLVLKHLKVLGLIDVTLTTTAVPDQSTEMRIRTTSSELNNIGYGVSDSMGMREFVSNRDVFIQKFRGNENEILICSFDGKRGAPNQGHRISSLAKNMFVDHFTNELAKSKHDDEIQDAIRRTFLSLNKEINGILSAKKSNSFAATPQMSKEAIDLNLADDGRAGCSITVIYIKDKKLYTANVGDIEALLSRNNGDHVLLTNKHDPTNRPEFERIRASGGYVSGEGALDGDLPVSRGVGYFNYLPHTNSGPDISEISLTSADDMIVVANKILWDFVSYELAVDILRQEKDDAMLAAQKLRDYAICYGATDKIAVSVITLGDQKSNRSKFGSNALYHNLGRESDLFAKKRRDRGTVAGDSSLRRLEEEIEPPVGELALVFTDIKNSTLLWDAYPLPMRSAIKMHNSIMRRQLRIVGGYEVKTEGDAFMVSFPSPTAALLWCFNVQQNLLTVDWPSEILETDQCCEVTEGKGNVIFRGLSVRMGIHWGSPVCEPDVVTGRMDYFGPMVNRASRISAVADGGQIAVSSDFLDEMQALYKIHEDIKSEKLSVSDAYQGNIRAGEIIEKEISAIEDNGCHYFKLGERKLKGLETPEPITLAFTSKLKIRFEIFQKRISQAEQSTLSTRVVGALPVDSIYGLRTISLRLENICSSLNSGVLVNESFQNSSDVISEKMNNTFKESDLIGLLNHIVTRIESCVATLNIRQQLSLATGGTGILEYNNGKSLIAVLDEITQMMASVQVSSKKSIPHGYIENSE